MKKIFFFLTLMILLMLGQVLAEMNCELIPRDENIIAAECYEIKNDQFNTTRPIINVTFQEQVDVYGYELRRIGNLNYDLDELEGEYFQEFNDYSPYNLNKLEQNKYQPSGILADGLYAFKLNAFNEPNVYLDIVVFFEVNASQMNFWVKSPTNHTIEKPKFAVSSTKINNLTIETERPVEGCKWALGSPDDYTREELYDYYSKNFTKIDNTILLIEDFDFESGYVENTIHGFRNLHVVCKEEAINNVPAKYSYNILYTLQIANSPKITSIYANPQIVRDFSSPKSILNITTDQTSACYIEEIEPLPENQRPKYEQDANYLFDKITYYKKNNIREIEFKQEPVSHEYIFNITCTNLANLSSSTTQMIKTNFTSQYRFTYITPNKYSNTKNINVSGAYTRAEEICKAKFNDEETEHTLKYISRINQGANAGNSLYQETISKTKFLDGEHTIHVWCSGMPEELYDSTKFTLDTKSPTNTTITTGENSCSLTEIKATLSAEDENGIDYFEYKLTYKGKEEENYDRNGTTTKTLSIGFTTRDGEKLENDTFELKVIAVDRAGNKGKEVAKSIKITNSNLIACDNENPRIKITPEYYDTQNQWKINVSCADQDSGCKKSFTWGTNTNTSAKCDFTQKIQGSINDSITITQEGLFCAEVSDLNNNKASKSITLNKTYDSACAGACGITGCPPCEIGAACTENRQCLTNYCDNGICENATCDDTIKNGFETDTDCGGTCDKCDIGSECNNDIDCKTGNCIDNLCEAASCTNNKLDGNETDTDCGGPDCSPCKLSDKCKEDTDCAEGECIGSKCTIPAEPILPEKTGPNTLGLIMLIIGVLSISGGGVLLYLEDDKKKTNAKMEDANKMRATLKSGIPRVTNLDDKQPAIKQLSPQEVAMRKQAWENSLKEKDQKRKEILDNFEQKENTKDEKDKDETSTSTSKKPKTKTKAKDESIKLDHGQTDEYVELGALKNKDDVFEKLKSATNKNKNTTKKQEEQNKNNNQTKTTTQTKQKADDEDFFEKLKEMNKKKKTKK